MPENAPAEAVLELFILTGNGYQRISPVSNKRSLPTELVVSQYHTGDDEQYRHDCCRDKKQNCHSCAKAEQHQTTYSLHIIPQSIYMLYDIVCGLSSSYSVFSSSAAAISSATFNASGETSWDPPVNLLTKSGTMSRIFVMASCCLMLTSFVTPF